MSTLDNFLIPNYDIHSALIERHAGVADLAREKKLPLMMKNYVKKFFLGRLLETIFHSLLFVFYVKFLIFYALLKRPQQ